MKQIKYLGVLLLCLAGNAMMQAQTQFSMRTSLEQGKPFSFTLNYGVEVVVDWGNGTVANYVSLGDPITGTLQGATVTVRGSDITLLECAGQQLTELNVSELTDLGTLLCQNNELTTLNITQNRKLVKLNAAYNKLTALSLGSLAGIKELVVNNNQLTSLGVSYNRTMTTLVCNDNQISSLTLSNLTLLQTLWCQNNKLTALNLSKNTLIGTLMCQNNAMTTLNVTGLAFLTDVWCNDNTLKSLDLSSNATLAYLSADNAAIETLTFGATDKLTTLYLNNNRLGYAGLISPQKPANYTYHPQDSMRIARSLDTNADLDLSAQLKTADNVATNATFKWFDGEKLLTAGTDYTGNGGIFRFQHPIAKLYGEISSPVFLELPKILTTSAVVLSGNGVRNNTVDKSLTLFAQHGKLIINSHVAQPVRVFSITGVLVRSFEKLEGSVEINLPRGTYIVNRTKITL